MKIDKKTELKDCTCDAELKRVRWHIVGADQNPYACKAKATRMVFFVGGASGVYPVLQCTRHYNICRKPLGQFNMYLSTKGLKRIEDLPLKD